MINNRLITSLQTFVSGLSPEAFDCISQDASHRRLGQQLVFYNSILFLIKMCNMRVMSLKCLLVCPKKARNLVIRLTGTSWQKKILNTLLISFLFIYFCPVVSLMRL